jgi:hypothetical protein
MCDEGAFDTVVSSWVEERPRIVALFQSRFSLLHLSVAIVFCTNLRRLVGRLQSFLAGSHPNLSALRDGKMQETEMRLEKCHNLQRSVVLLVPKVGCFTESRTARQCGTGPAGSARACLLQLHTCLF